ncbi:MAG TPA: ATP-binding cassette domain-containing protein [Victivallales bacterium]|nr:ATP-binding cassette domain-containing protein [Victivallales bacterium]
MMTLDKICINVGNFAVRDLSLEISEGEYFVLLGPNGSGKTLLVNAICGLIRLSSGRIILHGEDMTNTEPRFRNIGYMPQDCGLFPHLTVEENIIFTPNAKGVGKIKALKESREIVHSMGLENLAKRYPYNLSGGEKQKVAIARALAGRPKMLILDEPLSALDPAAHAEILEKLLRINSEFKVTTFHICHNRNEASQLADRVAQMTDGKLVAAGQIEDLRQKNQEES